MASIDPNSADMQNVLAARKQLQNATEAGMKHLGPCPADLEETIIDVPTPDGTSFRTIVVRPASAQQQKCPLIVFFHGGGFTVGSPEFCLSPARGFARLLGAIVACPSYKYTPEHRFPEPSQSAWEIAAWLSRPDNLNQGPLSQSNIEYDPELGMIFAGISAGATLAAVIGGISAASRVSDDDGNAKLTEGLSDIDPKHIKGLYLSIPCLVNEQILPAEYAKLWTSRVDCPSTPFVNVQSLATIDERLRPDFHSPWYSPLNTDLKKIGPYFVPKVYMQAGQLDMLRDDAVVFEAALQGTGAAQTRIDVIQNSGHVGWSTVPMPEAHTTEIRQKSLDGMAWLLNKTWDFSKELPY